MRWRRRRLQVREQQRHDPRAAPHAPHPRTPKVSKGRPPGGLGRPHSGKRSHPARLSRGTRGARVGSRGEPTRAHEAGAEALGREASGRRPGNRDSVAVYLQAGCQAPASHRRGRSLRPPPRSPPPVPLPTGSSLSPAATAVGPACASYCCLNIPWHEASCRWVP